MGVVMRMSEFFLDPPLISPFANKSYLDCNFLKNKDSLGPEKEVLLCKLLLEGGYFLS